MPQCRGLKSNQARCELFVPAGQAYCRWHASKSKPKSTSKSKSKSKSKSTSTSTSKPATVSMGTCHALTKHGGRCQNRTSQAYCHLHRRAQSTAVAPVPTTPAVRHGADPELQRIYGMLCSDRYSASAPIVHQVTREVYKRLFGTEHQKFTAPDSET